MLNLFAYKSILAETLREDIGSYTVSEIVSRFNTPRELMEATMEELVQIKGIGPAKAKQIIAVLQLAKLMNFPKEAPAVIRCPSDVYDLLRHEIGHSQKEHFVAVFLNTKNYVINTETISIGSLNSAVVHPRELFRASIKRSAASIVVAHNHPSGDPTPSSEDIELTRRIVTVGELVGIEVLDHCVICSDKYYSLKEHGQM